MRALLHVTQAGIPGLYNVAADGRLPWSEVAAICGHRPRPPLTVQPSEDPTPGPPVRPARRAGGSPALRPWRRHQALGRHRVHVQRHQRRRRADLHPSLAATPRKPAGGRRRTPTSTTWSSSSGTRPPSWAAATPADALSLEPLLRPARARARPIPQPSWRSARGPPTHRRSRGSAGRSPPHGCRASRPPAGWPGSSG